MNVVVLWVASIVVLLCCALDQQRLAWTYTAAILMRVWFVSSFVYWKTGAICAYVSQAQLDLLY